ncbi:hypothetical protein [Singulisphaera acidiphila]|uniref:Uncharacterized protein n=1 Tax=Singulisphaera acidiphila (strain ATCC BAA-1392 / DSM 18658 / VKM B-2454 / MOB10) TaxID=886293 RepID=L0D5U6_SINAD|nr:hypothetical protein [Singulisphaera acidiphila]AGA24632.1 hypothetical protein Sinac_0180 [Singulisphaera acidiphila DSM 18658]
MPLKLFVGLAFLGLLGLGISGCSGSSDPVASSTKEFTVAPQATMTPEEIAKVEQDAMKKQAEADKKAGKR